MKTERIPRPGGGANVDATKYTSREDLEAAVQEKACSVWREATGRDWSDHDTGTFSDRVLPEHELRALAVTRQLHDVLVAAAQFGRDYQLVPGSMDVVGPDRRPLQFAETAHTRELLRFIERELPAIDSRTHDVDGRIVGVSNGLRTDVTKLGTIRRLEVAESGWRAKTRGRVVSLLGDLATSTWSSLADFRRQLPGIVPSWSTKKGFVEAYGCTVEDLATRVAADELEENPEGHVRLTRAGNEAIEKLIGRGEIERDGGGRLRHQRGYWLKLGFRAPPTSHLMACASLLLGCWPKISADALERGVSVEQAIARERTAIERITATTRMEPLESGWHRRVCDPDWLPFGERAREKLARSQARRATLENAGDRAALDEFMRGEFVPWYNRWSSEDRLCEECFSSFEFIDPRQAFCSDDCSSRQRNRGRTHDGRSEIARSEIAKRRTAQEIATHVEKCNTCHKGEPCATRERLLGYAEPFTVSSNS
jgi:hypothetical protein